MGASAKGCHRDKRGNRRKLVHNNSVDAAVTISSEAGDVSSWKEEHWRIFSTQDWLRQGLVRMPHHRAPEGVGPCTNRKPCTLQYCYQLAVLVVKEWLVLNVTERFV